MREAVITKNGSVASVADVYPSAWKRLASRRVFFAHQSVGGNVMQGVAEVLAGRPDIPLDVIETADPSRMSRPGLYHARLGENGSPGAKLKEFCRIVSAGIGDSGTAMLKYCYADVSAETDPAAMFEEYRVGIDALRMMHEGLTIVHVTMPLMRDRGALRHVAAVVRRRPSYRQVDRIRHRYNELMRRTYGGREPIFDLAHAESTTPDWRLTRVRYAGEQIPVLAAEWTCDGGHLNERGRRHVAEALLVMLASAQSDSGLP